MSSNTWLRGGGDALCVQSVVGAHRAVGVLHRGPRAGPLTYKVLHGVLAQHFGRGVEHGYGVGARDCAQVSRAKLNVAVCDGRERRCGREGKGGRGMAPSVSRAPARRRGTPQRRAARTAGGDASHACQALALCMQLFEGLCWIADAVQGREALPMLRRRRRIPCSFAGWLRRAREHNTPSFACSAQRTSSRPMSSTCRGGAADKRCACMCV